MSRYAPGVTPSARWKARVIRGVDPKPDRAATVLVPSWVVARSERAHGADHPELAEIRATFERLRSELEHHLADEESSLFPACRQSADRATFVATPELLEHLEHEHAAAGTMLERLSQLTDGYDTSRAACNTHRAAIDGLRELELDMHEHVHEENNILFPRVLAALAA